MFLIWLGVFMLHFLNTSTFLLLPRFLGLLTAMSSDKVEEIDLGIYQPSTHNPEPQHSFRHDASVRVSVIACVGNIDFHLFLTFIPFRRTCNFVYHEYEIRCLVPSGDWGVERLDALRPPLVNVARILYEAHFRKGAGYSFNFSETE